MVRGIGVNLGGGGSGPSAPPDENRGGLSPPLENKEVLYQF